MPFAMRVLVLLVLFALFTQVETWPSNRCTDSGGVWRGSEFEGSCER